MTRTHDNRIPKTLVVVKDVFLIPVHGYGEDSGAIVETSIQRAVPTNISGGILKIALIPSWEPKPNPTIVGTPINKAVRPI